MVANQMVLVSRFKADPSSGVDRAARLQSMGSDSKLRKQF